MALTPDAITRLARLARIDIDRDEARDVKKKLDAICAENAELKQQLKQLQERMAVMERIATDPAERTAREIESLR